ncbi:hypothetical protein GOP47_0014181 [Adiantum capillus-veneris]|uniref:Uncharacterized protein n=1 Tax=Adiantum capillus-veneris TaxID=13818 RepID=A0A9D4UQ84_ADICA|nr:hypothetical protein GOP47_0014181 [Adiantum capillus-veneris]
MPINVLLALMATFWLAARATAVSRTDPDELQAVYDIMAATGNGWAVHIPDVCKGRWHGIECSPPDANSTLHITSLSFGVLSDDTAFPICNKHAFISPAIARLSHLRRLFFYKCCTANPQPIPAEAIASLGPSLEVLVLRQNGHVGAIPESLLSNLTNLHTLDLHGNSLSSPIPPSLGLLHNLLLLDLSRNQLSAALPFSLSQLTSLRVLDLSFNGLQGLLLDNIISQMTSLKKLDLGHNNFTGILPSLGFQSLQNLLLLDLSFNSFEGSLPPQLGQLGSLQALILDNAGQLGSEIPVTFQHLAQLEVLVMTSSGLVGEIPDIFYMMGKLKVLRMDNNKLTGAIPISLANLEELGELRLSHNRLAGTLPFSRDFVWRLGQHLHVNDNTNLCFHKALGPMALKGIHECKNSLISELLVEKAEGSPSPLTSHNPPPHRSPFFSHPLLHTSNTLKHSLPISIPLRILFLIGLALLF